ncbi:MAG: hypothetical protein KA226_09385 [Gemmatimonadales bacterium]|nr:hypothetical protein [Gemmatimonadales bacterium]
MDNETKELLRLLLRVLVLPLRDDRDQAGERRDIITWLDSILWEDKTYGKPAPTPADQPKEIS